MTELKEYPWEREVLHRLPPQDHNNIEDLKVKAQQLATRNAKLELEKEQLRIELQRAVKQRSFVKKKAEELSVMMANVYSKYEELERTVAEKDRIIGSKDEGILLLQEQLRVALANSARPFSNAHHLSIIDPYIAAAAPAPAPTAPSLEDSSVFITHEEAKGSNFPSTRRGNTFQFPPEVTNEVAELRLELATSRQEAAALRAAQLELEGAVAGQLVYSMHTTSQQQLNLQTQFDDDNASNKSSSKGGSSSKGSSTYSTPQRLSLANTPGAQRQMAGQSFWTIPAPQQQSASSRNNSLNMSALSERNGSFVRPPQPPRALSLALGQLSPIAPAPSDHPQQLQQQQQQGEEAAPDSQRVHRLVAALQRAATINNNNSSFVNNSSTNNARSILREEEEEEEEEQEGYEEKGL